MLTQEQIQEMICKHLSRELNVDATTIDIDISFHDLGLDSVNSLFLLGDLEEELAMDIDPLALYDNPTISSFATFIYQKRHETR